MLETSDYQRILIDKRPGGVTVATLNRPDKLNAIDLRMRDELTRLFGDYRLDQGSRVLVLTGAGRSFCAGGDITTGRFGSGASTTSAASDDGRIDHSKAHMTASMIVNNLLDCPKPIIAAVNGHAMGLGANIALLCDVVIAGPSTTFSDPHVKIGIGAGDGGQVIWPLLMGVNRAKWYLMTGDSLNGPAAYDLGLVTFLVEADAEVMDKALACADQLATGAPLAISASKVPVNQFIRFVSNLVLPLSLAMELSTMQTADAEEGGRAFLEHRAPSFEGR